MTQTASTTISVAATIQPTITFSTFSALSPPATIGGSEATGKPRLRLVQ